MDNKQLKTLVAIGITATTLVGCGFNPENELDVEVYGPAPIFEEEQSGGFNPANELDVEVYGPAPIFEEKQSGILDKAYRNIQDAGSDYEINSSTDDEDL